LVLAPAGAGCKVFVGKHEIAGVTSIEIRASVDGLTVIDLRMYALGGVTVEGIAGQLNAEVTTQRELMADARRVVSGETEPPPMVRWVSPREGRRVAMGEGEDA